MFNSRIQYLSKNVHEYYNDKVDIQKLVFNSYAGGQKYRDGEYLHKYNERETDNSYNDRQARSIYFNNVQPLADMLVGFLYTDEVIRRNIKNTELLKEINDTDSFQTLMQRIATSSILMTTGVLVDSPYFEEEGMTERRRKELGLKPVVSIYEPWRIRNFYFNTKGELEWLLLDNSYLKNKSPFEKQEYIYSYRLWERDKYTDFTGTNTYSLTESEPMPNNLGEIPFIFANWTDTWDTVIADSVFEDIALYDQSIYNYMSLFDENLYAGTFKMLAWPGKLPKEMKSTGLRNMIALTVDKDAFMPGFISPKMEDMEQFLKAIDFVIIGALRKLGLNTDLEKNYTQSGVAKSFDFKKVKSFLTAGAKSMENVERRIIEYYGKWEQVIEDSVEIEYEKDFLGEEQQQEFINLIEAIASIPSELYKKAARKKIVDLTLKGASEEEIKAIKEEIDSEKEEEITQDDINNMSEEEQNEDEQNDDEV